MTELICYPPMPEHSLVILIEPSGAGKSTIARTWPASQALSLDALRETVSDDFSVKFSLLGPCGPVGTSRRASRWAGTGGYGTSERNPTALSLDRRWLAPDGLSAPGRW
ncbi:hypothetical protein ACIOYT_32005 [Streptomyces halstedii]|uniref:hypothetical protein n=1 Tax=Streptomyces halstedii TaxID=1944 RepID=UPI0037FB8866